MTLSAVSLGNNNAYADASSNTRVNLEVTSRINITAPGTVTMNCSSPNNLCTSTAGITVSTNNATGYTLQMNATNSYSNALTNTAASATVPTLSGSYSSANFPVDYWGYTGGLDKSSESGGYNCASNYCPVLAYQSTESNYAPNHAIKITDAPGTSSVTNITFGAKTSRTKPAGTYSTSVTFTAVGNYAPYIAYELNDGLYMQQVDGSTCANTAPYSTTNKTYTLMDARDNITYTVAKLKDNNCWMTQNLELGKYGEPMTLTSDLSNVPSNGYTLTLPYANNSVYKGNSNHYGNYYNWNTATAGSGTSTAGENAPYSICPKNWRLPRTTTVETNSEYYTLLNENYITTGTWVEATADTSAHWSGVTTSQFTNAPVSLVFSGGMESSGALGGQGAYGDWWSSTSNGSSYAFYLRVNTSGNVYPRFSANRGYGFTVRCLVPGS